MGFKVYHAGIRPLGLRAGTRDVYHAAIITRFFAVRAEDLQGGFVLVRIGYKS
jgi:hypothetical protein